MFESGELIPFYPLYPAVLDSVIPGSKAFNAGLQSDDQDHFDQWTCSSELD